MLEYSIDMEATKHAKLGNVIHRVLIARLGMLASTLEDSVNIVLFQLISTFPLAAHLAMSAHLLVQDS